jgi:hypothetical protein
MFTAMAEMRGSQKFGMLLQLVQKATAKMVRGTRLENMSGIKLDSLLHLSETRAKVPASFSSYYLISEWQRETIHRLTRTQNVPSRLSFLDYLASKLYCHHPQLFSFLAEMPSVTAAARVDLRALEEELRALEAALAACDSSIAALSALPHTSPDTLQRFSVSVASVCLPSLCSHTRAAGVLDCAGPHEDFAGRHCTPARGDVCSGDFVPGAADLLWQR